MERTNNVPCQCGRACYLSEYGQQTWPDRYIPRNAALSRPASPRMRLHHGVLVPTSRSRLARWLSAHRLVVVVVAMLALTAVLPFVWCQQIAAGDGRESPEERRPAGKQYGSDEKLGRIMRSLRALQSEEDSRLQQQRVTADNLRREHFPWLIQHNALPNYFLREDTTASHPSQLYKSSPVVFLHHHRAAGSAMKECLRNISDSLGFGEVPDWTSDKRALRESKRNNLLSSGDSDSYRVQTGQYSFGVCDGYSSHRCSYFVLLRDPMERAVSSYHFCQAAGLRSTQSEMCRVVDANDVTLRDWILLQGSSTFQAFLYNATWCRDHTPPPSAYALDGTDVHVAPSRQWPCWLKQRVHVDTLAERERSQLLDYIIRNMETWFSVVGLTSHMDDSLTMLEKVYDLPFSDKCAGLKRSHGFNPHDNKSNRNKPKDGYFDDNDPYYLKYDYFVRKALDADYQIYKKAQSIYKVQSQMVFNTL